MTIRAENCKRLSGTLQLIEDQDSSEITEENIENGIGLMYYYISEFDRLQGSSMPPEAKKLLDRIHKKRDAPLTEPVTATELARSAPGEKLRKEKDYMPAMEYLEKMGHVTRLTGKAKRWEINADFSSHADTQETQVEAV